MISHICIWALETPSVFIYVLVNRGHFLLRNPTDIYLWLICHRFQYFSVKVEQILVRSFMLYGNLSGFIQCVCVCVCVCVCIVFSLIETVGSNQESLLFTFFCRFDAASVQVNTISASGLSNISGLNRFSYLHKNYYFPFKYNFSFKFCVTFVNNLFVSLTYECI